MEDAILSYTQQSSHAASQRSLSPTTGVLEFWLYHPLKPLLLVRLLYSM